MNNRFRSMAVIGAFASASFAGAVAQAAQPVQASTPQKKPAKPTVMVPLLAVSRITSPDRTFIVNAIQSAITTMSASQAEMEASHQSDVQSVAVRAFNSAASAYNSLADIAAERRISVAAPGAIFDADQTPSAIEGAPMEPADIAYLSSRESALATAIALYSGEIEHGRDPKVVTFARQMKARLEHDLLVTTVALQSVNTAGYGDRPASSDDGPDTLR